MVIAPSGYANYAVMTNFKKDGFSVVATKPYKVEELEELLHRVINWSSWKD